MIAIGRALGKVILLGEHSVVYGRPALAGALSRGVEVRVERRTSGGFDLGEPPVPGGTPVRQAVERIASAFGVEHARLSVTGDIPAGGGLGSSAAFACALSRAFAGLAGRDLTLEDTERLVHEAERVFHLSPSGVDGAICARGGVILFQPGNPAEVRALQPARPLPLVVGLSGRTRGTADGVRALASRVREEPPRFERLFDRLGELALAAAGDVTEGRLRDLGARMDEAHAILHECGVSSVELEAVVRAMKAAGAWGAKLTGAGGGGAAIALTDDPERVMAGLREAGFESFAAEVA